MNTSTDTVRIPHALRLLMVALLIVPLAGCAPSVPSDVVDAAHERTVGGMMVTEAEAEGWTITADDGDVGGESTDCTGAPFVWPDNATVAHASQFLDREGESVAVIVKRTAGQAAVNVDAVRRSLAPCTDGLAPRWNGAMIELIGDDSFAYQTEGSDEAGDWTMSNMVVSCGSLLLETMTLSYSKQLDQAELESLVSGVASRMTADQDCD